MKIKIGDTLVFLVAIGINIFLYRYFAVTEYGYDSFYRDLLNPAGGGDLFSSTHYNAMFTFFIFLSVGTFYFLYLYFTKKIIKSEPGIKSTAVMLLLVALFSLFSFHQSNQAEIRVERHKEAITDHQLQEVDYSDLEHMISAPGTIEDTSDAWNLAGFSGVAIIITFLLYKGGWYNWRRDRFFMRF